MRDQRTFQVTIELVSELTLEIRVGDEIAGRLDLNESAELDEWHRALIGTTRFCLQTALTGMAIDRGLPIKEFLVE